MPSYAYVDGDGLSVIDKTLPNGAVEPVSNLDDALKQVKAYLKDATAGVAKIQDDVTQLIADVADGQTDITDIDTRLTAAEADIDTLQTQVAALQNNLKYQTSVANSSQVIDVDATDHVLEFDTIIFNVDGAFDAPSFTFTAAIAGYYQVNVNVQVDNIDGTPAGMEVALKVAKNGATQLTGSDASASPPGSRWYPGVGGLIQLAPADQVIINFSALDGVNTGSVTVSNGRLSIFRT